MTLVCQVKNRYRPLVFHMLPFKGIAPVLIDIHVRSRFNQDTVGFPRSVPGCTRVRMSSRAIVPRCAGQTRGSLQSRNRKVENGISSEGNAAHACFRGGPGRFSDIARPPGHRLTPDRFHPLRKSLPCFLASPFFQFS